MVLSIKSTETPQNLYFDENSPHVYPTKSNTIIYPRCYCSSQPLTNFFLQKLCILITSYEKSTMYVFAQKLGFILVFIKIQEIYTVSTETFSPLNLR